jgi:hypothetical protein
VDVGHAERGRAAGLAGQRLLVIVQPEIDDVRDAQRGDLGQLRLARLAGGGEATSIRRQLAMCTGSAISRARPSS